MSDQPTCELCGEPMPPGEEMFKFHGYSGNCPKPPLPRRTLKDAIAETERLLTETFDKLDPDNDRDAWFIVRITKIREALADRPGALDSDTTVDIRCPKCGKPHFEGECKANVS